MVNSVIVKAKDLSTTISELKEKGGYILAVTPTKFKLSGKDKDVMTATDFAVVSRG